jgi:hypothetical protein
MKVFLKLAIGKVFSGLSWLFQSFIENWKIWIVITTAGYLLYLKLEVRGLKSENSELIDTVYAQDSVIIARSFKYYTDSTNMAEVLIETQKVLSDVNSKNKKLELESNEKDQLIKDLADGIKCKNIFGRIVNCKKKD